MDTDRVAPTSAGRARRLTRRVLPVWLLAAGAAGARAQPATAPFDPFPGGIAARYRFDLARNFWPSPAAEEANRREVVAAARRVGALAATAGASPAALLRALRAADTLMLGLGRHYSYLSLRSAVDIRDVAAQQAISALAAEAEPPLAALDRTIGRLEDAQVRRFLGAEPALRRYAFAIERARRAARRRLGAEAERAVAVAEPQATGWGPALFSTTLAATDFGTVRAPEGELDVRRQPAAINNHADRSVREAGYRRNLAGLASRRDTYAFILTRTATARNALARLRGYADYRAESYDERYLTTSQVEALLEALAARADVNKRYERLRVARAKRLFGWDTVHTWDLTAPAPGAPAPRFTITEASEAVVAAAAPLGEAYVRELRALLDPANGRLDVAPGPNRVERPGFSTGSVGYPSTFYQGRYEGYVEDLVILAHEAGHAVQNMLMDRRGVLPRYASGPNYFTESYAAFAELLVLEHLYRTAPDRARRIYFLQRLLDQATEVFRNGFESLVEHQLYDSASAGRLLGADQIESLTQATGSRFSIWHGPGSERQLAWVRPLQFYTRPLYRLNYVYAKLLGLRYLDLLRRDPAGFAPRYAALLANGYDAPPDELLRRFAGVGLYEPAELTEAAVRVIERWRAELERLYAE